MECKYKLLELLKELKELLPTFIRVQIRLSTVHEAMCAVLNEIGLFVEVVFRMKYRAFLFLFFASTSVAVAIDGEKDESPTRSLYEFYELFDKSSPLPDFDLFKLALTGHLNLREKEKLGAKDIVTIIDFRKPSTQKRLWVIDLASKTVLFHTLVAHGRNTGDLYAEKFSNTPNSNSSSIGFYVTDQTYLGKHGLSLYLDGQEKSFNEKARERAIVMHGADYVSGDFIKKHGRLGRSLGCPSVSMGIHKQIIDTIKDRTSLLIFYPDRKYLAESELLRSDRLAAQLQFLNATSEPACVGSSL